MSPVEARSAATAILRARVTKIGNLVGLHAFGKSRELNVLSDKVIVHGSMRK